MKKLVCLLAVLALASVAFAAPVYVVQSGVIQSPWVSGGTGGGNGPYSNSTDPADSLASARRVYTGTNSWPGWSSIQSYPAMTSTGTGNDIMKMTMKVDGPLNELGAIHLIVNPTDRWAWVYKWENTSLVRIDGGAWTTFSAAGPNGRPVVPNDGGYHVVEIDLKTNAAPTDEFGAVPWTVGASINDVLIAMQSNTGGATTWYIRELAFVPEPATMALLGLGGLALIRRKR